MPIADGQQVLEGGRPAAQQPGVTYKGTTNGDAVYEVGSGSYRFLAATVDATSVDTPISGNVPATLALTLSPASFGAFTPGVSVPRLAVPSVSASVAGTVPATPPLTLVASTIVARKL